MTARRRSVYSEAGTPPQSQHESPILRHDERIKMGSPFLGSPSRFSPSPRLDQQAWANKSFWRRTLRGVKAGDPWSVLGALGGLAGLWLINRLLFSGPRILPPQPCNAFTAPGQLLVNLTHPLSTRWLPFDMEACPPNPDYLSALWALSKGPTTPIPSRPLSASDEAQRLLSADPIPAHLLTPPSSAAPAAAVSFLHKRSKPATILILGDSVDRNGLTHFCQLMQQNPSISLYSDMHSHPPDALPEDLTKGHGPRFEGWDQRGLPHLCEIPFYSPGGKGKTALRVVNGFHYGMDALDEFDTPDHLDWHKPGKIEDRIDELVMPYVEQLGGVGQVDLISLHSGMWDLALFGMQDDKTKSSLTIPLTPEQLAWWQERMHHTIWHVRTRFPKTRIVFRKMHRTDDVVPGTQYITNLWAFIP